jgi:hypothetical protein
MQVWKIENLTEVNIMFQIFEITLKPKEIDLGANLTKLESLSWYVNGLVLVKDDDGLQYILDLSNFTLKCVMGDLFSIDEGDWSPQDFPSREELVNSAILQLQKLPFKLETAEIHRVVRHERKLG